MTINFSPEPRKPEDSGTNHWKQKQKQKTTTVNPESYLQWTYFSRMKANKRKTLLDKFKQGDFTVNRPVLQETLREVLQAEGRWYRGKARSSGRHEPEMVHMWVNIISLSFCSLNFFKIYFKAKIIATYHGIHSICRHNSIMSIPWSSRMIKMKR